MSSNQNAPERVESVQPPAGADAAAPMRDEAVQGFSTFSDVRSAMTTNSAALTDLSIEEGQGSDGGAAVQLARFGIPNLNGGEQRQAPVDGEIDPENSDSFNTPVITPDEFMTRQELNRGREIEEGRSPNDRRLDAPPQALDQAQQKAEAQSVDTSSLSALDTRVSSEFGDDGKVNAVDHEVLGLSARFDLGKDGEVTRTTTTDEGTEVATFGADGKPISRQVTGPDGKVLSNDINPDDSVRVFKGDNGQPMAIVSNQNGARTVLDFDKDGMVSGRSIENGNQTMVTEFDKDGEPTHNVITTNDENGNLKERQTLTKDTQTTEKFDAGKLTEKEEITDDAITTTRVLSDGSSMIVQETDHGTRTAIVDKDGKVALTHSVDADGTRAETNMYNKDGSHVHTVETPDSISSMTRRPDGSWESTRHDKSSNHTQRKVGRHPDDPGVEQRDV